jgi:hypothetical protein
MAAAVKEIVVEGKTYPIVFSSNALARLEEETGMATHHLGLLFLSGRAGYRFLRMLLWAGLEGARLRIKGARRNKWELDEVGDLIDAAGGDALVWGEEEKKVEVDGKTVTTKEPTHEIGKTVYGAWSSAFPAARPALPGTVAPDPHAGPSGGQTSSMPPSNAE